MGDVCLYPDEVPIEHGDGEVVKMWRLLIVHRDEPGYTPSKYGLFDTEEEAWDKAMWENVDMGIQSKEEVFEIVESSIMAQDLRDGTDLLGRRP